MSTLKKAIQDTINYARFFDFELTTTELHHWLISGKTYSLASVSKNSNLSDKQSKTRQNRTLITQKKLLILKKVLPLIKLIPSVRLIAVTGSLAMENAKPSDDVDIMIITSSNTLWLTRPFIILILSLFSNRRSPTLSGKHAKDTICPNLWLDTNALLIPKSKQNLYTAHEVLQIKPVLDRGGTYQQFLKKNSWTKKFLTNAYQTLTAKKANTKQENPPSPPFSWLNKLFFLAQYLYMYNRLTSEYVTLHSAYFHPRTIEPKV